MLLAVKLGDGRLVPFVPDGEPAGERRAGFAFTGLDRRTGSVERKFVRVPSADVGPVSASTFAALALRAFGADELADEFEKAATKKKAKASKGTKAATKKKAKASKGTKAATKKKAKAGDAGEEKSS